MADRSLLDCPFFDDGFGGEFALAMQCLGSAPVSLFGNAAHRGAIGAVLLEDAHAPIRQCDR